MNEILEQLSRTILNPSSVNDLSRNLGIETNQAENVLGSAIPAILKALLRNSNQPGGLEALFRALVKDHGGNGNILNNGLGDLIKNPNQSKGGSMLEHIFGDKRSTVESQIGRSSGLDLSKISRIMKIAAPIVLAILGQQRRQKDLNSSGIQDILRRTNDDFAQNNQRESSILEKLIDRDGDGNAMDDLANMGLNVLKNWMMRR